MIGKLKPIVTAQLEGSYNPQQKNGLEVTTIKTEKKLFGSLMVIKELNLINYQLETIY